MVYHYSCKIIEKESETILFCHHLRVHLVDFQLEFGLTGYLLILLTITAGGRRGRLVYCMLYLLFLQVLRSNSHRYALRWWFDNHYLHLLLCFGRLGNAFLQPITKLLHLSNLTAQLPISLPKGLIVLGKSIDSFIHHQHPAVHLIDHIILRLLLVLQLNQEEISLLGHLCFFFLGSNAFSGSMESL